MNRFLIDTYTGSQGRTSMKSYSAYSATSQNDKEFAVETAKKLREKMKKDAEKATKKEALFEMAEEAKARSSLNDARRRLEKDEDKPEKTKIDPSQMQSDEELKNNLKTMAKLNEKLKTENINGSVDDVLSSILSDLF